MHPTFREKIQNRIVMIKDEEKAANEILEDLKEEFDIEIKHIKKMKRDERLKKVYSKEDRKQLLKVFNYGLNALIVLKEELLK